VTATLRLEGCETGVAVERRSGFFGRLTGLLGQRVMAAHTCLWLDHCAAVHTFGMRFAVDLAFVSHGGVVLRVAANVPAGCIRWTCGAHAVVEANAGALQVWGVRRGSHLAVHWRDGRGAVIGARERGSATIEFVAAAMLVLLPLVGAIFEGAQLAISRQLLTVAVVEAARAGAVTHGDLGTMQRRLARGLVPLFGAPVPGTAEAAVLDAYARAWLEVQRPDLTRFLVVRPTAESFADFAVEANGDRQIPTDGDSLMSGRGAASGLTLAQSNILAIRVRYCRRLVVPVLDEMITAALLSSGFSTDPFDRVCLAQGRVPIDVRATMHMQSPARAAALGIDQ